MVSNNDKTQNTAYKLRIPNFDSRSQYVNVPSQLLYSKALGTKQVAVCHHLTARATLKSTFLRSEESKHLQI